MIPNTTPILPEVEPGMVRVSTELDGLHSVEADILPCDDEGDPAVVYCWFKGTDILTIISEDAVQDIIDAYEEQLEGDEE